ncbi:protein MAINTENANCE OF MERISTEMS-like [Silene latifolia]|uniref:protein MAINTENANCE OF MERISTEMS-like n=1 Tax=Silene latifolia TaxID=37657 RepID=UPI003D7820CA
MGVSQWIKNYERPKAGREIREIYLSEVVVARVEASGLGILRDCFTTGLDDNLLSAFIERWHPDTNTFHMPFGGISIMLHDVQHILGIPVTGERSDDRVNAQLLPLFDSLDRVGSYAWCAACLAYLYLQLGTASRRDGTGVSGCLPLLQAWIYEYFPKFQPGAGFFLEDRPLIETWDRLPRAKGDSQTFQMYRHSLDDLSSEHV